MCFWVENAALIAKFQQSIISRQGCANDLIENNGALIILGIYAAGSVVAAAASSAKILSIS